MITAGIIIGVLFILSLFSRKDEPEITDDKKNENPKHDIDP